MTICGISRLTLPATLLPSVTAALPWLLLAGGTYELSELAEKAGLPSAQLLVALITGVLLALAGVVRRPLPATLAHASHAVVGALMGSYLDLGALRAAGSASLPLVLITVVTIAISLAVAAALARFGRLPLQDSVLGLVPGGSAAIVVCSDEVGADARLVALAQYLRVGLVALTAPTIVLCLGGRMAPAPRSGSLLLPMLGHVSAGPAQTAQLVALLGICLLGGRLGRRLSLPAPILLGTMVVAAVATASHAATGFAPSGPLRDVVFVVVGLEVGLRFSRPALRSAGRALPGLAAGSLLVCGACAGLAWLMAWLTGTSFLQAYLATTPGGINAVLATAASAQVNVAVVSTVQALRLFAICLLVPPIVRWLAECRATPASAAPDPGSRTGSGQQAELLR